MRKYYLEASRSVLLPISMLGGWIVVNESGIYGEIATFINNYTIAGKIESSYHLNGYVFGISWNYSYSVDLESL